MTTQPEYSKIYTHTPKQHPNLILGSLQLLFWVFFRPKVLRNYIKPIHPVLNTKLIIQAFFILPVLARIIVILFLVALDIGIAWQKAIFLFLEGVPLDVVSGVGLAVGLAMFLDVGLGLGSAVVFGMAFSVAFGVVFGVPLEVGLGAGLTVALDVAFGVGFGVGFGVALELGLVIGLVVGLVVYLVVCLGPPLTVGFLCVGLGVGLSAGLAVGLGLLLAVDFAVEFSVAFSVGLGAVLGAVLGADFGTALGIGFGIGFAFGLTIYLLRPIILHPLLIIWSFLLHRLEQGRTSQEPSLLRFHPAFWDEWLYIPFQELDKHLLLVIEKNPDEGKAAINYLSTTRQRWAAQAVQIELDARTLEAYKDINDIAEIASKFEVSSESPIDSILNNFQRISKDTEAALKQTSNYNQRLVLKPICEKLQAQIEALYRSDNKYASRFQPIAIQWHDIISDYIEKLAKETELRQEIDSPYIIGVPLTLEQQIFTGRNTIGSRIEQLLLDRRRPPLLLYGQRRMGKTSLLNNLKKLLPNSIIPMFVDLQGTPSSAKDSTGFLFNLAKQMISSAKRQSALTLPPLTRETLENDPFTDFDEWLDKVEQTLEQNTALLMLDEFEVLDKAISKGRFDEEDVLGMLRHLIQHRPKFKVLIAGSHTIEEYQRWASYLINVQVVGISYLLEHEARQLIENPIEDFKLRYEADAVERILQLTRCHPFLVQLMCSELVALKNEQDPSIRRLATLADVEATIAEALNVGSFFFADIQNNQVDATGLEILRFMAARGEGGIVSQETIALEFQDKNYRSAIVLLNQRQLIEEAGNGYKFQVELIRRWFQQ